MLNSPIVDVAIGLVFCYAALALTVSTITEAISSGRKWRSTTLFTSVKALLNDTDFKGLAMKVLNHALVSPLADGKTAAGGTPAKLPSYIPSSHFATALVDAIHSVPGDYAQLKQDIEKLPDVQLRDFLLGVHARAGMQATTLTQFTALHQHVADWFDNSMERASGDYKRRAQAWTFGIALLAALALNIDSIHLLKVLWNNPGLTAGIANPGASADVASMLQKMQELPVGWSGRQFESVFDVVACVTGILITAITALFGAPFWFDALQQLVRLRGTGNKPKTEAESATK